MQRIILILLFVTLNSQLSYSQCNPNQQKDFCVKNLSEGYTFIKSYTIEKSKVNANGEIEYSFVFSKGTNYMLTIADQTGKAENIEIILYDPQHKKIISNFDKKSGAFFPIQYTCTNTGVHYMTFKYHGSGGPCGISVLGFKR